MQACGAKSSYMGNIPIQWVPGCSKLEGEGEGDVSENA
jgi:hypothetical protein